MIFTRLLTNWTFKNFSVSLLQTFITVWTHHHMSASLIHHFRVNFIAQLTCFFIITTIQCTFDDWFFFSLFLVNLGIIFYSFRFWASLLLTLCFIFCENATFTKMKLNLILAHWAFLLTSITKIITLDVQWISTFIAIHSNKFMPAPSFTSSIGHIALLFVIIIFTTPQWTLNKLETFEAVRTFNWLIECKRFRVCSSATIWTRNKIPCFLAMWTFNFITNLLFLKVIIRTLALRANSKANFFTTLLTIKFTYTFINNLSRWSINLSSTTAYHHFKLLVALCAWCHLSHLIHLCRSIHTSLAFLVRAFEKATLELALGALN